MLLEYKVWLGISTGGRTEMRKWVASKCFYQPGLANACMW